MGLSLSRFGYPPVSNYYSSGGISFAVDEPDIEIYFIQEASVEMAEGEGSGPGNFVWAIALIIIVAIIAAVVMSGGFLTRGGDKNIDVEIKTPAR